MSAKNHTKTLDILTTYSPAIIAWGYAQIPAPADEDAEFSLFEE